MTLFHRPALLVLAVAACIAQPLAAAVHVVDVTRDSVDAVPGDGACADAFAGCSLRAAVQESNATPGADRIELAAATYVLAIAGLGDDVAASGDLDVSADLEIVGVGTDSTVIDAAALDRVLDLHAVEGTSSVRLRGLVVRNGVALLAAGSAAASSSAAMPARAVTRAPCRCGGAGRPPGVRGHGRP